MAPSAKKKISPVQKLMLVEEMERNPHLNSAKNSPMYSAGKRATDWKKLANRLNQVGDSVKSVEKWQKTWSDMKGELRKKCNGNDRDISSLNCRVLSLMNMTGLRAAEEIDSKECIIQSTRIRSITSLNDDASQAHLDPDSSMDSSCVLAVPNSHAQPVVENSSSPVVATEVPSEVGSREPLVVESRAPPEVERRVPPEVERRVPSEVISRAPPVEENRVPPVLKDGTFPDKILEEVVALDSISCQKLIAAEEASGAAMKSIALQLGQLVKAESRKATAFERTASAFERIADAVDRISNHFCT